MSGAGAGDDPAPPALVRELVRRRARGCAPVPCTFGAHWRSRPHPGMDGVVRHDDVDGPVMRIVGRMPRVQVYLPDDLHDELKRRGLPASELLQIALRAELERQDALDATTAYLADLAADVGEPSARQTTHAEAIARRVRARELSQAR